MIADRMIRRSGIRGTAILLALTLAIELVFSLILIPAWTQAAGDVAIPDMSLFRTYDEARASYDLMKAGDGAALAAYRAIEIVDMVFPLAYSLAFFGLIALAIRHSGLCDSPLRILALTPLLAGIFDLAENVMFFTSIAVHPGDFGILHTAAASMTALKFVFFSTSAILSLAAITSVILRWRRPRAVSTVLAPKPIGPYSQAVKVGSFLFISGQLGLDPESGELAPDARSQAERIMSNLEAILEAERLDTGDLVKTTIFLTDMADFGAVNEVYGASFVKAFPARSTIQVAALPKGAKVEVEAIARLR